MKVVICVPTVTRPFQCLLDSIAAAVPLMDAKGYDHNIVYNIGCPYISYSRALMVRKSQEAGADVIIFLDHDLSFPPESLIKLIETEGDLVAGTYRFKEDDEKYMGSILSDIKGYPQVRESDGAIKGFSAPAGFLKITKGGLARFMLHYPELQYVDNDTLTIDLFNHGAYKGVWYGEDYALCRRWIEKCGDLWIIPNIDVHHHTETTMYPGNFHHYLTRQPGGSESNEK
jgi:glycosyltransferase involved in cell wall biosynthesis